MSERNGLADRKQHLLNVSCSDADLSTMPLRRLRTLKVLAVHDAKVVGYRVSFFKGRREDLPRSIVRDAHCE